MKPAEKRKKSSQGGKKKKSKKETHNEKVSETKQPSIPKVQLIQGQQCNTSLSLSSQLKRARGTASSTPLPPHWSKGNSTKSFLSLDQDGDEFLSCRNECYRGFCWDDPDDIDFSIHEDFKTALNGMDDSGLFLYDIVQPGGKKSTFTMVTRTLVGNPGSTYKYLGLRLFSHPWCSVDNNGDVKNNLNDVKADGQDRDVNNLVKLGYKPTCARALIKMGRLNKILVDRTKEKLEVEVKSTVAGGLVGSADFTITLINRMEPTSIKKDLKAENIHGLGMTSVGWHKDSGVQDFSSIAVYHVMKSIEEQQKMKDIPWRVALRVADSNTSTPALSVPLPSGACYYLLDDFNHQHEHAVIAGSDTLRYSSTHRVARDGSGTFRFIQDQSAAILSTQLVSSLRKGNIDELLSYNTSPLQKKLAKEIRSWFQHMYELEFDWIRMWNVQGQHHADLHPYWHQPIEKMKETFNHLKHVTNLILAELKKADNNCTFLCEDIFDVAIEAYEDRKKLRDTWKLRLQDKIFKSIPKHMRPIACDTFDDDDEPSATEIRSWRSDFILKRDGNPNSKVARGGQNKMDLTCLTKKEKKKVASNWQRMKTNMQKKK